MNYLKKLLAQRKNESNTRLQTTSEIMAVNIVFPVNKIIQSFYER